VSTVSSPKREASKRTAGLGTAAERKAAMGRPSAAVTPGQAGTERLTRVVYLVMGVSALVFGALSLESFLAQASASWLSLAAWLILFGLPATLGLLSRWAPLPVLRVIAVTEGLVFLLVLGLWLTFRAHPLPVGADIPWILTFTGIPTICVAIIARPVVVWGYTVLVCTLSGVLRGATSAGENPALTGIEDGLYSLLLLSVVVGLAMATRRSAARVTTSAAIERDALARSAARVARKQERLTIDALVHDSVISTLLTAGSGRVAADVVSQQALKTLDQLDALRARQPADDVPCSELERSLRQLTADLAPDASFRTQLDDDNGTLPASVVAALLGAASEALRNSVANAGGSDAAAENRAVVNRTVELHAAAAEARVTVRDDGVGFEPTDVPAERLGISRSIIGRMELITGGAADVQSRLGAGTEVTLVWSSR
jgi:signal transduction histidine kinase